VIKRSLEARSFPNSYQQMFFREEDAERTRSRVAFTSTGRTESAEERSAGSNAPLYGVERMYTFEMRDTLIIITGIMKSLFSHICKNIG